MKADQDERLVQSLDTPDRKMYAPKEQLVLRLAETRRVKRRRLEFGNTATDTEQEQHDVEQLKGTDDCRSTNL